MKKKKKKQIDVDCGHNEESANNVYMFHNIVLNIGIWILSIV